MDQLPQISLGGAVLIIFVVSAVYMIFRGLLRTLVNTAILAGCAWVGFQAWQQAPAFAVQWTGNTHPWITTGLPILAFFVSLFIARKLVGLFRAPLAGHSKDKIPRSFSQLVFRLVGAFVPTTVVSLVIATILHHFGSVAELRDAVQSGQAASTTQPDFIQRMKTSIDAAVPASILDFLDPFTSEAHLALVKKIATNARDPLPVVIDPSTGKPYPRAIIVDEPALDELAKDGRYSTLLRHPLITEALNDPKVRKAIGF